MSEIRTRAVGRNRREARRRFRKLWVEHLEDRRLLTTAARHVFAQLHGTVDGSDQQRITLAPDDFTPSGGKALLGFLAQPAAGSSLDLATVLIHDTDGEPMQPLVARHNIAGSTESLVLAELPLGTFDVTVTQQNMTGGDYEVDVFLVGDFDGDRAITLADGTAIRAIFGATASDGGYEVEADADRSGQITSLDYTFWRRNLNDSTTLDPLTLAVAISPLEEQPDGSLTTTAAAVDVTGSTLAGQLVVLDVNGNLSNTNAAVDGSFSFQTELPLGLNQLSLSVTDTFGQHREHSVEVTRVPSDSEPPVIAVGLANDTGESAADLLTFDPAITGSVTDASEISAFGIAIGSHTAVPPPSYVSALDDLQVDGTFLLGQARLESLLGLQLPDGHVTLALMATDGVSNTSFIDVSFTLDATPPTPPQFDLSISSDSGVVGDQQTAYASVTLTGTTDAEVWLELLPAARQTLASTQGEYFLPQVTLVPGGNPITIRAFDVAGNSSQTTQTFMRLAPDGQSDPVLFWNQVALEAIRLDADTPPEASRMLAILHAAILDAVSAIDGTPAQYVALPALPGSSPAAAVAGAAHAVLSYVYPAQQSAFDAALAAALTPIPAGDARTNGLALGQAIAEALLRLREADGYDAFVEHFGGQFAGQWRPTAFMFDVPLLPQWGDVQPFIVSRDGVVLPSGPPDLASQQWEDAFHEVKSIGDARSTTRTADQTDIARFWTDGLGTYTPPGHWNQIAGVVTEPQSASLADNARLFAQLNLGLADAAILTWYVKYSTDFWRPITAIQQGQTDGNDLTAEDRSWIPLLPTPAFPEYVSGHSAFSGTAAGILTAVLGDDVPFTVGSFTPTDLVRSFSSFNAAAEEAALSRLYGGIHYRFSNEDGLALGQDIAQTVLDTFSVSHDARPPAIVLDHPPAVAAQNVELHGQILDNLTGLVEATVQVDDGLAEPLTLDAQGRFTLNTNFLTDGTDDGDHLFLFRASDAAGNESTRELKFTFDTLAPALSITAPADNDNLAAGARLIGTLSGTGSPITAFTYRFDGGPTFPLTPSDSFEIPLDLSRLDLGAHALTVSATDAAGNDISQILPVTLPTAIPLQVTEHLPLDGADDVGSTFRPKIDFSRPIDPATLTADNFFATDTTGEMLPANIVVANDGTFAWLFFHGPMPGSSTITVTVDGSTIGAADGSLLDAAGTGVPGSTFQFQFTTVSLAGVPGTTLSGVVADPDPDLMPMTIDDVRPGPDGVLNTADDVYLNPLAGVRVWILGLESEAVFTDAQGRFHIDAAPTGNVKLAVDGRTATNAPAGFYFPEMVMDLTIEPARANTVMGSMGKRETMAALEDVPGVYLPRLRTSILQTVNAATATTIGVSPEAAPNLTPQQRSMLSIEVQPGSLIGPDGQTLSSGEVGISTVPPEMVREMLPPGVLQHTFDITVQAMGISNFSTPAPMTFPNIFGGAPGEKFNFLSFDHTTGRLVIEGTATVSEDGLLVRTDPGTGITHPGWHGLTPPGSPVSGNPTITPPPPTPPNPQPVIRVHDVSVREGDPAQPTAQFLVELVSANPQANDSVSFELRTISNTAIAGKDFQQSSASVTLTSASPTLIFEVPIINDDLPETSQFYTVEAVETGTGNLLDTGIGTIADDYSQPGQPSVVVSDDAVVEGGILSFQVSITGTVAEEATVTLQTFDGTAVAGIDYVPANPTITFQPGGATQHTVQIQTMADPNSSQSKQFSLEIIAIDKAQEADGQGIGFIQDVNAQASLIIGNSPQFEGDSGSMSAVFNVRLIGNATDEVTVTVSAIDGTGTQGIDVTFPSPITLTFPLGTTEQQVQAQVIGDTEFEDDEVYFLTLANAVNATILGGSGLGTIINDDQMPSGPTVTINDAQEVEGNQGQRMMRFEVQLDGQADNAVEVMIQTATSSRPDKATPGSDYIHRSATLIFSPQNSGTTTQVFTVPFIGDFEDEGNQETFFAVITNVSSASIARSTALGTIDDDDTLSLAFSNSPTGFVPFNLFQQFFVFGEGADIWVLASGLPDDNFTLIITPKNGVQSGTKPDHTESERAQQGQARFQFSFDELVPIPDISSGLNKIMALSFEFQLSSGTGSPVLPLLTIVQEDPARLRQEYLNYGFHPPAVVEATPVSGFSADQFAQHSTYRPFVVDGWMDEIARIVDTKYRMRSGDQQPLMISSGFRSPRRNGMRVSQHETGNAIDFGFRVSNSHLTTAQRVHLYRSALVAVSTLPGIDQVILEGGFSDSAPTVDNGVLPVNWIPPPALAAFLIPDFLVDNKEVFVVVADNNSDDLPESVMEFRFRDGTLVPVMDSAGNEVRVPRDRVLAYNGHSSYLNPGFKIGKADGNTDQDTIEIGDVLTLMYDREQFPTSPHNLPGSEHEMAYYFEGIGFSHHVLHVGNGPARPPSVSATTNLGMNQSLYYQFSTQTGFQLIGQTNASGTLGAVLPPNSKYTLTLYDPLINRSTVVGGISGMPGQSTSLGPIFLSQFAGTDTDGDGLPDVGETAIGTRIDLIDTDGDGIDDATEIAQGLDPLDNRGFPTGVISSLPLRGEAREVVVEGSILDPQGQTAYIATGSYGLAIVEASRFQRPVILGQIDLPGDATDVAVDSRLQIAVVATNAGGLQFVDAADRTRPVLLQTINVNASQVEIVDGVAYAAVGGALRAYDVLTGELFETLSLGSASILSLAREGAMLYTLDSNRVLRAIDIGGFTMAARGSLTLSASSGKLFVGNGIAYVGGGVDTAGGFSTVDVSNPDNLILLSGVDALNIEGRAVVANGSGLAVSVGNVRGPVGQQFVGLDVLDVSVPTDTSRFLTRIVLPSAPSSVAIAAGIGFVANGTSGLQVVNYVPFDNQGQTPTVSIRAAEDVDLDPNTDGIQVLEGSSIPIVADISDDVQVRNAELLVNGEVVRNDVSFPFDFSAIALPLAPDDPTTVIRVRATDTGGNVVTSSELSIETLPDQFAPTVLSVNPAHNTVRPHGLQAVTIRFSEPIASTSATAATFQVFGAGQNGQLGDVDDVQVGIVDVRLRYEDSLIQVTATEPLPIGVHELRISEPNVLDRAGNSLGSGTFRSQFEVVSTDFTVNTLADTVDAQPGDGRAADATGATSLRAAIMEANALGEGTITLPPGTYSIAIPGRDEDAAATGDLDINARITLLGAGAKVTIIHAHGLDRVFHVLPRSEFGLSGVTVTGGNASGVINVRASGGGGLLNDTGHLTIDDSTISNNTAAAVGGGISHLSGTLLITRSTLSGNSAPTNSGDGGGLYMDGSDTLATIVNSTFSGNSAQSTGAGIRNDFHATLNLLNNTFANNIGRALDTTRNASTSAKNTLFSGSIGSDSGGQFINLGNNLIGSIAGLGPLRDNGGPTLTHALLPGSPAIDAADNSSAPETDQRGVSRPQDGNSDGVARADIGAFEFEVTVQPLLSVVAVKSGSPDVAELDAAELALTFQIATGIWAASEATSALDGVALRIADLPGSYLGFATRDTIWIDVNAAGHGWYVGAESPEAVEGESRFDLLTVILHELGHVLGHDDLDSALHHDELMAETLMPGQRRLPHQSDRWKEALDQLFAEWDE